MRDGGACVWRECAEERKRGAGAQVRNKGCGTGGIHRRGSGEAETDEMIGVGMGEEVRKRGLSTAGAGSEVVDFKGERLEAHREM